MRDCLFCKQHLRLDTSTIPVLCEHLVVVMVTNDMWRPMPLTLINDRISVNPRHRAKLLETVAIVIPNRTTVFPDDQVESLMDRAAASSHALERIAPCTTSISVSADVATHPDQPGGSPMAASRPCAESQRRTVRGWSLAVARHMPSNPRCGMHDYCTVIFRICRPFAMTGSNARLLAYPVSISVPLLATRKRAVHVIVLPAGSLAMGDC